MKRGSIIAIVILAAVSLIQCSKGDLSRPVAESKLNQLLPAKGELTFDANDMRSNHGAQLASKPEFVPLQGLKYATMHVVVTGIRKVSESDAIADWQLEVKPDKVALQKIIDAFAKVEKRLGSLQGKQTTKRVDNFFGPATFETIWEFTDPSDKQIYDGYSPDIKQTKGWNFFQSAKSDWMGRLNGVVPKSPTSHAKFLKYDDGWRAEESQGER